ncbi:protein kinase [Polyangium jinanense]|uniref:serine/threonine-protein kinase n=1 Tax=Polyangium jinanense TaxID=2829994 RepID=UPI0023413314|nr:serine/threonine-protein kinase [Polyangium jinanense]MDC3959583.1 protein kinase [Polyangium jinanense]
MRPGDIIGERFRVERLAGVGGMGEVYRAEDLQTGNVVAVKLLRASERSNAERLAQEARVLETLGHPHIVRYVDHGVADTGAPWLAMEWLEGESLAARLGRKGLRLEECITLAVRVADALATAHARGVVHRDIKPSNLFLERGEIDRVKVLDFGVARDRGRGRLTLTGTIVGTPGYMAPEQARADKAGVDARADVFSLGTVLFECLTGQPAFDGEHAFAILASLLLTEAPRVRDLRPDVPEALDDLVARMLAKDVQSRPSDASAVARALLSLGPMEGNATVVHATSAEVITDSERQLLSIVAALPPSLPDGKEAPSRFLPRDRIAAIEQEIAPLGARVEEIEGGALLIGLVGRGNPTDQAARAARAALRLRTLAPEARIVLVTGREETSQGLALGSISKRAAALLDLGEEAGAVRIDASTQALLDVRFDVSAGADGIFLRGEREVGSGTRTLLGKPSPYLGRERELRSVRDFLEEGLDEGKPRVALVLGLPGMGKSRLRHELVEQLRRGAVEPAVAIGRGDPIGAGSAFSILGSAIRTMAQIGIGEPVASRRHKLEALIATYLAGDDLPRVTAFLGEMVGAPASDDRPDLRAARQNAALMADRIREAWLDFVEALSVVRPLVVVLEDLHWGDRASIKLVDAALAMQGERRFAVLALARPELHDLFPKIWADRELLEVRLGELGRRAAERLVQHFLGEIISEEEIQRLVDRASGNAFYLEELIRAVAEGRGSDLPETVLGMVEARLMSLDPEARRVLRAASVFGQSFWWGGVAALIGDASMPNGRVGLLDRLCERELIVRRRESRFLGEEEYAFRHALVREGSYAMLTERDRRRGHALAAEWLLASGETDPTILADHFESSGDKERSAEFFAAAAELALSAGDFSAAVSFTERGLVASPRADVVAQLRAIRADALNWTSSSATAYEAAMEALDSARPGTKEYARALGAALGSALLLRKKDALASLMDELYRMEPVEDAVPAVSFAYSSAVISQLVMGQRAMAERFLHRMEQVFGPFFARDPSVAGCFGYARGYWHRVAEQDPYIALGIEREAIANFMVSDDRRFLPLLRAHVGLDLVLLGAYDEAEREFDLALAAAPADSVSALLAGCFRAALFLERGRLEETITLGTAVADEAAAHSEGVIGVSVQYFVLEAHLRRGDLDAVRRLLTAVAPLVEILPLGQIWSLAGHAAVALAEGRLESALELSRSALARTAEIDMKHTSAHARILLTRAEALWAAGKHGEARAAIEDARAELLARVARIPDPAYARTFLEAVPLHTRLLDLWKAWCGV